MKQFYFKAILVCCLFLTSYLNAQITYTVDCMEPDSTCPENTGLDATYVFAFTVSEAEAQYGIPRETIVGTFMDTNAAGTELSTLAVTAYAASFGTVTYEFYINDVLFGASFSNTDDPSCDTATIAGDPNVTKQIAITLSQDAKDAYNVGGLNTISVIPLTPNGFLTYYGFDLTATTESLSADEFALKSVKIFPNPAADLISINGLKKTENYKIFNVLGTEISNGVISENASIDIKNYKSGLYFLSFDNGTAVKFIKE